MNATLKALPFFLVVLSFAGLAYGEPAGIAFWFSDRIDDPGAPGIVDYTDQIETGSVTLYLWADNEPDTTFLTIGLDLDFRGTVIDPRFSIYSAHYSFVFPNDQFELPLWDVVSNDVDDPKDGISDFPAMGIQLDDLRWAAVQTPGLTDEAFGVLDLTDQHPILLGTLQFDTDGRWSEVEVLVGPGSIGTDTQGEIVDAYFGVGETPIDGNYLYNLSNDLP